MEGVFLEILNMSISASWLILAVIIIRALLSKAPKGFRYILWVLVAVRLVCPFTLESALSLIPSAETIPKDIVHSDAPQIHTGIGALDETINPIISENFSPMIPNDSSSEGQDAENPGVSENEGVIGDTGSVETPVTVMQMVVAIAVGVWCIGILAMLIYTIVSYMQLWKKVKVSVRIQDNVWINDEIRSPFILGIIRPRIYLPSHIEKEQMSYIIAHEKEHLRCLDYVWKPLGFLILTVHWFNPLVWVAYVLLCRDIELACDERVIRTMDAADKRNYSEVLLACSSPRHFISACPVAFGEIGIKERIKKILTYKKPAVWIMGIAAVACVIVAICFMTNPKAADIPTEDEGTETERESDSEFESEYKEQIVYRTTADVTQDGFADSVEVVKRIWSASDEGLENGGNDAFVRVYKGYSDGKTYQSEPIYESERFSTAHSANGTIVLTAKDDKAYLLYSNMYEHMGEAYYEYKVYYVGEENREVIVETNEVSFATSYEWPQWDRMPHREDVIPDFKTKMAPWIEEGIILFVLDVVSPVYLSTEEKIYPASAYYDTVWARKDEEEPVTSIDEGYKAAYTKHLNEFRKEHKETAESMRGGWVYIDGDEIPELAIGKIGEMHLYTYKDGKIYQLMNDWAFLDAANTGYSYLLKQNAIFNLSITGAGRYVYLHFWKINTACELEEYYTEDLWYQYVTDENGGSSTIRYFYGENQISEEEFKGYIIGGNFKIDSEPEGYKDIWRYPKKIEELLDELSY